MATAADIAAGGARNSAWRRDAGSTGLHSQHHLGYGPRELEALPVLGLPDIERDDLELYNRNVKGFRS